MKTQQRINDGSYVDSVDFVGKLTASSVLSLASQPLHKGLAGETILYCHTQTYFDAPAIPARARSFPVLTLAFV